MQHMNNKSDFNCLSPLETDTIKIQGRNCKHITHLSMLFIFDDGLVH